MDLLFMDFSSKYLLICNAYILRNYKDYMISSEQIALLFTI